MVSPNEIYSVLYQNCYHLKVIRAKLDITVIKLLNNVSLILNDRDCIYL